MIDPAGGGEDHPRRPVVLAHVADEDVAGHLPDQLRRSQHRAAQRLTGEGAFLEAVEDDVVGRVLRLA